MSHAIPTASEFLNSPYDPRLEKEFFSRVLLPNGTFKTTTDHRLDDLNALVLPLIKSLPFTPLRIADVAASSGVSSAEWHDQLLEAGVDFTMLATDLTTTALHVKKEFAEGLFDEGLRPLHLSAFGRVMPPKARFPAGLIPAALSWYLRIGSRHNVVSLMSKRATTSSRFKVENDDITAPSSVRFHVLRAANILHYQYFDKAQLCAIMANLKGRLVDGGLFIVCRTVANGSNHGVACKLVSDKFTVLDRIGDGSEIEPLL